MNISFDHKGDINTLVIGVGADLTFDAPHLPRNLVPCLENVLSDRQEVFKGKVGESFLAVMEQGNKPERVLLIGVEPQEGTEFIDRFTLLGGHVARALAANKIKQATIGWHSFKVACKIEEQDALNAAAYFAKGLCLANYRFEKYITKTDRHSSTLSDISFVDTQEMPESTWDALKAIVEGVHIARDTVNEPPNVMNPASFVKEAEKLSDLGINVKVIKGAELQKLKMGCLAAVGRASAVPPRLLILEWRATNSAKFDYGFVGKGVTFDTGGLCLKPPSGMPDMKSDMGGGAAVLGAMHAFAARKVPFNIVAAIPLAENMISGDAYRPSDILDCHSGSTVEVIDTDAEGRLILADALSYVSRKYKPGLLVDLATLTGAIIVALGFESAGLFTNDTDVAKKVKDVANYIGEKVWELPLPDDYDRGLESKVADVRNLSLGYGAGSITAAQFLHKFIPDGQKWAHLDIAGVAFRAAPSPLYSPKCATGYGVRLLTGLVVGKELL